MAAAGFLARVRPWEAGHCRTLVFGRGFLGQGQGRFGSCQVANGLQDGGLLFQALFPLDPGQQSVGHDPAVGALGEHLQGAEVEGGVASFAGF